MLVLFTHFSLYVICQSVVGGGGGTCVFVWILFNSATVVKLERYENIAKAILYGQCRSNLEMNDCCA